MTFILLVSLQFGRGQQRQLMPAPLSVSWVGSISRTFALFGGLLTPTSGWGDASSWCLQKPGLLGHLILSPLFPMWPLQHGGFRVASFFDTGPGLQKYISRERETDGSCPSFSNSCNVTPPLKSAANTSSRSLRFVVTWSCWWLHLSGSACTLQTAAPDCR